jgi:hypothetical protein
MVSKSTLYYKVYKKHTCNIFINRCFFPSKGLMAIPIFFVKFIVQSSIISGMLWPGVKILFFHKSLRIIYNFTYNPTQF